MARTTQTRVLMVISTAVLFCGALVFILTRMSLEDPLFSRSMYCVPITPVTADLDIKVEAVMKGTQWTRVDITICNRTSDSLLDCDVELNARFRMSLKGAVEVKYLAGGEEALARREASAVGPGEVVHLRFSQNSENWAVDTSGIEGYSPLLGLHTITLITRGGSYSWRIEEPGRN